VRTYAQGEVQEQTGLSAKLKQLADAKGATLPSGPDAETTRKVAMLRKLSGAELNRTYLRETGVAGHELLERTMSEVQALVTAGFCSLFS
jgi:putative membrane protein